MVSKIELPVYRMIDSCNGNLSDVDLADETGKIIGNGKTYICRVDERTNAYGLSFLLQQDNEPVGVMELVVPEFTNTNYYDMWKMSDRLPIYRMLIQNKRNESHLIFLGMLRGDKDNQLLRGIEGSTFCEVVYGRYDTYTFMYSEHRDVKSDTVELHGLLNVVSNDGRVLTTEKSNRVENISDTICAVGLKPNRNLPTSSCCVMTRLYDDDNLSKSYIGISLPTMSRHYTSGSGGWVENCATKYMYFVFDEDKLIEISKGVYKRTDIEYFRTMGFMDDKMYVGDYTRGPLNELMKSCIFELDGETVCLCIMDKSGVRERFDLKEYNVIH